MASQINVADDVVGAFNVSVTVTILVIPPPVIVMVAVLSPRLAFAVFTMAVMVPLFEPDVTLSDSQEVLSLAVQVPFEVRVIVWFVGFAAP